MLINAQNAYASRRYEGRDLYFCSEGCVRRFDADPQRYVQSKYMREYIEAEDAGREVAPSATTGVRATVDGLVYIELPLTGLKRGRSGGPALEHALEAVPGVRKAHTNMRGGVRTSSSRNCSWRAGRSGWSATA